MAARTNSIVDRMMSVWLPVQDFVIKCALAEAVLLNIHNQITYKENLKGRLTGTLPLSDFTAKR